jgi:hypothetical protein
VIRSVFERFPDEIRAHLAGDVGPVEPEMIAELRDITAGTATVDEHHRAKQPDWTYDNEDSGQWPADRLAEHRIPEELEQ